METGVEEAAAAEKIRNLALLDPALNDEQRVAIQNMSDKQILEMVAVITKQVEKMLVETQSEKDDWFTQVKDQWTELRQAQREERRERAQDNNEELRITSNPRMIRENKN